jgi:hypothetical protein
MRSATATRIYHKPNAGRPQAGAGKEKDTKTHFLKFQDWGVI